MKKKQKWMRLRHRIVRGLARILFCPFIILKYGIKIETLKGSRGKQYLLLYNHQTPMDQFFVGLTVKSPVYFLATEDIFSNGFISWLLKFFVAPIPIKKNSTDVRAVMNCFRLVSEGGTLAIAPEGNRTYSGKTEYIAPSIIPLIKKMGIDVAFVRLEGGYGVQPRWSDKTRKGKMRAYVSRIVSKEEYSALSDDELYSLVCSELYVNEAKVDGVFKSKRSAEYLERMVYVCPHCGFSKFTSKGDTVKCTACGLTARYTEYKTFEAKEEGFPFRFADDWYEYQKKYVNLTETYKMVDKPIFTDVADIFEVIVYRSKKKMMKDASVSLYGDRIEISDGQQKLELFFSAMSGAVVLGRNKLNVYVGKEVYQFKGGKSFNALKYVNLYYRYKNCLNTEVNDDEFLGL